MFKWEEGRQKGTKYKKFKFLYFKLWKFGFDGYILKYEPKTVLDWHLDPVENGDHYRFNLTLKGFSSLFTEGADKTRYGGYPKAYWFRPDLVRHKVVIHEKPVTKLSLGFVLFK